jgi:hypothetical protein
VIMGASIRSTDRVPHNCEQISIFTQRRLLINLKMSAADARLEVDAVSKVVLLNARTNVET